MALYGSIIGDILTGAVDFANDTFYALLVTDAYVPNYDTHNRRDDITNEVAGTGYTTGGEEVNVTVGSYNASSDSVDISFDDVVWESASFTARAAVIYKLSGSGAASDPLVAYVDFGSNQSVGGGDFTASFSSPLTLQITS